MKIIIITILFSSLDLSWATSERTETSAVHNDIILSIINDRIVNNREVLPSSFEDITDLRKSIEESPWMLKKINLLALVPGTPIIQQGEDILRNHSGQRLFAIGRSSNFDYEHTSESGTPEAGRYSILIAPDGSDGFAPWIPESEVQAILSQIKDFNPENQPLAFQDLISKISNKITNSSNLIDAKTSKSNREINYNNNSQNVDKLNENMGYRNKRKGEYWWLWIIGVIFLTTLLIWIRRIRCTGI